MPSYEARILTASPDRAGLLRRHTRAEQYETINRGVPAGNNVEKPQHTAVDRGKTVSELIKGTGAVGRTVFSPRNVTLSSGI